MTIPRSKRSRRFPWRWVVVPTALLGIAAWQFDLLPEIEEKSATIVDSPDDALAALLDGNAPDLSNLDSIQLSDSSVASAHTDDQQDDPLLDLIGTLSEPEAAIDTAVTPIAESINPFEELERQTSPSHDTPLPESEVRQATFEVPNRDQAPRTAPVTTAALRETAPDQPEVAPTTASAIQEIDHLIQSGQIVAAHRELSTIWWNQVADRELIQDRIRRTAATIYASPETHVMPPYQIQPGETLQTIAGKFDVSWQYLEKLNGIDAQQLPTNSPIKTIRGPFGAVVDLDRMELTVHAHGYYVHRYDIGIGRDHSTPVGEYAVESKVENPIWYRPEGGIVGADDPANPLGEHWIGLGNSIGIHGTIDPDSIGTASSRGCVRMRNEDVAELFHLLTERSTVLIRQ